MGEILFCPKRMYHQLEDRDQEDRREREKKKQNYDNMFLRVCYCKMEDGGMLGWVYSVHCTTV
jgi:hypothetical protein